MMGDCSCFGCGIYIGDTSRVEIVDCLIIGVTGIYVTQKAQVYIKGSAIRGLKHAIHVYTEKVYYLY